jgi:chaperonin GroEL
LVAPDFGSDALTSLVVNHLKNKIQVCAIKTPLIDQEGLMSVLHDLAAYTGATVVSKDMGMHPATVDPVRVVGRVRQVKISKDQTILIGGFEEAKIDDRTRFLENFVNENPVLGEFDLDILSERISKLRGGLMVIQPGGRTSVEVKECRDRVEDSLNSVRSAIDTGYLPGGGYALLHAA